MKKDNLSYLKTIAYTGESLEETQERIRLKRLKRGRKLLKKGLLNNNGSQPTAK